VDRVVRQKPNKSLAPFTPHSKRRKGREGEEKRRGESLIDLDDLSQATEQARG
jgi:hypothetical protein